jgi:RHS repeat-associated protein
VAYSSQFTYGADGLRRRSVVTSNGVTNVTDTVYDASMPVEEVGYAQGTNTPYVSAMYLIGPRGPEYRRDVVHQSVAWYVYDGLGSIVEEVDPSGNITAARKYDVYGLVRSGQLGSSSQKYVGSLGHESDTNTGLIYMRARYMDPVLGRFLSEDPGRDGINWCIYCRDNPISFTDYTGLGPGTLIAVEDGLQYELSQGAEALYAENYAVRKLVCVVMRYLLQELVAMAQFGVQGTMTYHVLVGTMLVTAILGKDPSGTAWCYHVQIENNGTRFYGLFSSKDGNFYNLDCKSIDPDFWQSMVAFTETLEPEGD